MALARKILLVVVSLLAMAGGARAAGNEARTMLPTSVKVLEPGRVRAVRALRRDHLAKEMEILISLKMRDFPKLLARLESGEQVPQDEMAAKYLPLPADYEAVVDWAKSQGLTITQTDPSRLGVFVKGTVAQIQEATQAQFAEVSVADGTYVSAITTPSVPTRLAAAVLGVNGLQPHIHPRHGQTLQPQISNAPPYLVKEILGAYGATNLGYDGTGETIAILIDTFPSSSDLAHFWSFNGIPQSTANITKIQAVSGALDAVSGEETLDAEWTSGIASGAKIRIYATADLSFPDLDKGLQKIISDLPNQPSMHELSISLGLGETEVSSSQKTADAQYFASIANFGVSIFVASGDDGAVSDGTEQPSYYASDPSVTGVGGTTLRLLGSGAVSAETGWNGSGGGISTFFARPSWQVGSGVPSGNKRTVPDVASAADPDTGAYVYLQGSAQQIGGTSWATPTWAGFCALINEARAQVGLGPIGMLNPKIYPLLGTSSFRDITSGNNGGYSAGVGYDLVTGLGAPVMSSLLPALTGGGSTTPVITSFSPVAGVVGTTVSITGVNLTRVTGVQFNGTAAEITGTTTNDLLTTAVPTGATTGPITLLTATTSTQSATDFTVVTPATNDNFANATVITGSSGAVTGNNIGATKEPGEPDIAGDTGNGETAGASVWWVWQAPDTGIYTFSTAGSSFDTTEGVFTGTAVNALTTLAVDDDYGTSVTSSITFSATAGATYYIAVSGYQGATGAIDLTWEENNGAPVISNFSPQTGRAGTVVTVTGANFLGTTSVVIGGTAAAFSVTDDTQMTATVGTGAVTGPVAITGPPSLGTTTSSANFVVIQPVSNDDFVNATVISGPGGTITGNNSGATKENGEPNIAGNAGGKSIWYEWVPSSNGPETITTFGSSFDTLLGVFTGTNVAGLTSVASNDDYGNTVTSSVTFLATAGTKYYIAVDGFNGASGNVVLNWAKDSSLPVISSFSPTSGPPGTTLDITGSNFTGASAVSLGATSLDYTVVSDTEITALVPAGAVTGLISVGNLLGAVDSANAFTVTAAPANDNFADRITLTGATVHTTGANVGATKEPGEPEIAGNPGGASVWWSWTAPTTGVYAVSTQGSSFDTLLGVFTGSAVNGLTTVASNDDDPSGGVTSYLTITATAGTTYQIAVDGLNGASGSISLSIFPQQATTALYSTGFEAKEGFVAGQPLNGQNDWKTVQTGGNGIVKQFDGLTGQQAYVGFSPPTNAGDDGVFAYHPINYSPGGTSQPVVKFTVTMAINDSKNFNYDDFQWRLYNTKGHNFFTLDFDNGDLQVYYIQDGSNNLVPTGVQFSNNSPVKLSVTMDFQHNLWSATMNGSTLVLNKKIAVHSDGPLDLGDMDAVWQIFDPENPGDNYMLFDDYSLVASEDPAPVITFQPQSQTVVQGNPVTLGVVATGQAPLFYQWYLNKKPLSGANSASLTIPDVETINAGSYTVDVSNSIGEATSAAAKLSVTPEPSAPVITQAPASMTVAAGSTAVFSVAASGYPAPTYQWYYQGSPLSGQTRTVLEVRDAQALNQGSYKVIASNSLGSGTSTPAILSVGESIASEKGSFNGMVMDSSGITTGDGLLKVTMGSRGGFSGSLILGGKTYRVAGSFNSQGIWTGTVGKVNGVAITVQLQLALSGTNEITGSILAGGTTASVTALRDNYSKRGTVAPESLAYTMVLTSTDPGLPAGTGYASIKVDEAGNVKVVGRLGDSTAYSFSSVVSDSGSWPFYTPLYKSTGYIGGTLTFEHLTNSDVDGTLHWVRPADNNSIGGFSAGFEGYVAAAGDIYTAPSGGESAIPLNSQHTGVITFSGGLLTNAISGSVTVGSSGLLEVIGNPAIKFTLKNTTGVFSGSVDAGFSSKSPFYGVLLQKVDGGSGLFQTPTISGDVEITSP